MAGPPPEGRVCSPASNPRMRSVGVASTQRAVQTTGMARRATPTQLRPSTTIRAHEHRRRNATPAASAVVANASWTATQIGQFCVMRMTIPIEERSALRGTGKAGVWLRAAAMAGAIARLVSPLMRTAAPSTMTTVPTAKMVRRAFANDAGFACIDVIPLSPNDPSSATRPTRRLYGNRSAMAGFAAAHGFRPRVVFQSHREYISRRLRECDVILSKVTCLLAHHERQSLQAPPGQRP